jgi:hypothetical protein
MLFNQKVNALAMMGSVDDIEDLSKPLQSKGISLSKRNYVTAEDLVAAIKKDTSIEYVILSDSGMLGVRDGKYSVPVEISSIDRKIHVAIFFNLEKYNEGYIKWAAKYGIQCIYYMNDPNYTDGSGGFDFNKILKEIKENRRIFSKEVEPSAEESNEPPNHSSPKVITVEVEKVVPVQVVEREVIREVIKEVPSVQSGKRSLFGGRQQAPQATSQLKRTSIIGIYGSATGSGSTSLCIYFARHLASRFKVAVIERNLRSPLKDYQDKVVDIFSRPLNEINISDYDYVIIDFGTLYDLSPTVPTFIKNSKDEMFERQSLYGIEKKYCTQNILVCSALPWRLHETAFYLDDEAGDKNSEWIFYFNGDSESKELKKLLKNYDRHYVFSHENVKVFSELQDLIDK